MGYDFTITITANLEHFSTPSAAGRQAVQPKHPRGVVVWALIRGHAAHKCSREKFCREYIVTTLVLGVYRLGMYCTWTDQQKYLCPSLQARGLPYLRP